MFHFRNAAIRSKLIIILMVSSTSALILAGSVLVIHDRAITRDSMVRELQVLANVTALNSTAALSFNSRQDAFETLSALRVEKHILSAKVFDTQGKLFAEYIRKDASSEITNAARPEPGFHFDDNSLILTCPVVLDRDTTGMITLQSDLGELNARLARYAATTAIVLFFSSLVAFLLVTRLQKFITEPILRLTLAAKEISQNQDYSIRVQATSHDELGFLVEKFNDMLQQVQERDGAIRLANDQLESRVRERTVELENEVVERRWAEEESVKSNRLLSTLMANLPGMVYRCENDIKRTLVFASNGCLSLTGYAPDDLIENRWLSFAGIIHQSDRGTVMAQLQSAIEQGLPYQMTYRILTATGAEKWVWEQGSCSSDFGTGAEILEGLILDITERKHEEERRARLTTAVEQAVESIVITTVDGAIQYVNPAFETVTGYSQKEVIGLTPRILKSGKQDKALYENLWKTIRQGEVWQGRLINRRKDGGLVEAEATISPVRDANGNIINFVSVERDMTEMKQLEMQLRQAQKLEAVGSLAAGIAHEINTPIQFVGDNTHFLSNAFSDMLKLLEVGSKLVTAHATSSDDQGTFKQFEETMTACDYEFLRHEIPSAIDQTLQGIDRVATIVRAMKDFSHPDGGEKSNVDVNKALQTTLIVARNEIKYVADVKTEFADDLPQVPAYSGALNQVFLNLLINAAHAIADVVGDGTGGRGEITVQTRIENDHIVIAVSDTGSGISPEIQERIFDPFFTTKAVGRGTGQGLAIARSVVVDKHGGSLTFETKIGKGTTFYVRLPIIPQEILV